MDTKDEYGPAPPREQLRSPEQDRQQLDDDAMVSCSSCERVVPLSTATHEEGQDYLRHFCGQDCYAAWRKRAETVLPSPAPEGGDDAGKR